MNKFLSKRQFASKLDVKRAAEFLIEKYGAISILEVKNWLRNEGLVAFQSDISRFMKKLAYENNWDWEFNGRFRFYFLPEEDLYKKNLLEVFSLN